MLVNAKAWLSVLRPWSVLEAHATCFRCCKRRPILTVVFWFKAEHISESDSLSHRTLDACADTDAHATAAQSTPPSTYGFCWSASCTSSVLTYTIGSPANTVTCSAAGSTISLPSVDGDLTGSLRCPDDIAAVCRSLDCGTGACDRRGAQCFNGGCVCHLGWVGADCATPFDPALLRAASEGQTGGGGSSSSTTRAIIIGASIGGGVVALAVLAGIVFAYMNSKAHKGSVVPTDENGQPMPKPPGAAGYYPPPQYDAGAYPQYGQYGTYGGGGPPLQYAASGPGIVQVAPTHATA
eukprot:22707-Chlamydomonas_euryale.AAC.15